MNARGLRRAWRRRVGSARTVATYPVQDRLPPAAIVACGAGRHFVRATHRLRVAPPAARVLAVKRGAPLVH